jgi:hypothetical protein
MTGSVLFKFIVKTEQVSLVDLYWEVPGSNLAEVLAVMMWFF